ncbi:MAG: DnaJ domain-containing protein [Nitrospirae bacterium]|nr:DnaJ domain-containing protein [Nitrospirota bacterium]
MPVSGRFRDQRLPKILTQLQRQKKTGVLVVRRNDQHKSIFIKDGDIIFAASRYQDDWLGELLLKIGKITFGQYEKASEITRTTQKRFGTVLVELGFLSAKDLFWAVTHQVKEIILSVFTWLDGEYVFEEGPLPSQEVIMLKMSTANLILDGIRRINDLIRLRNELPSMNTVLQITTDPLILFQDIKLTDAERKLLVQMDGRSTISEILAASELPAFETLKLLYFFLSVGLVEIGITDLKPEAPAEAMPAEGVETVQDRAREASPPPESETFKPAEEAPLVEEALVMEVKQEQQEAVVEGREEIFRKEEQEAHLTKQRIREAYEALQHQDYYEVLGLQREATRDEIKRAYFRLAKEYHPDRHFQSGLEEFTPQFETLFRRITEAYDTLLMERKRKDYDTGLTLKKFKGPREDTGSSIAGRVQQGQQALQRGDFKTAAYYFEGVVKVAPDKAGHHAFLAKALTQIPGRQRDAETHYKKAIELDPSGVDHYIGLGLLYKKGGMVQRAQRQFEEALVWDPTNRSANDELKKLQT